MKSIIKRLGARAGLLAAALLIAAVDQLIKRLIERYPVASVIFEAKPLFDIVRSTNAGAAFSILTGETLLLILATSLMLALLLAVLLLHPTLSSAARWCLAFLVGGGIGNWIDRVAQGGVTDYIRLLFIRFPVFNFADICITLSVVCLIVLLMTNRLESHTGEEHGTDH